MKNYKYRFSIFTATYNRGNLLPKLYESLCNQTYKGEYEWIIVSDGSTDNTDNIVRSFIEESKIPIKYVSKENGGKHTAWRAATELFEGKYVLTADDDDPISLDILSIFDKYWTELETSYDYDQFWEVKARAQYENGALVGKELPEPYFDSDFIELTYKMKLGAEMVGCRKCEVLCNDAAVPDKFLFDDKCSNFPEEIRWARAARMYKTRFVPDIVRTYVIGHDSLCVTPKGQKKSEKKIFNNLVSALYSLNELDDIFRKYVYKRYLISILQLSYTSICLRVRVSDFIKSPINKLLYLLSIPLALLIKVFR